MQIGQIFDLSTEVRVLKGQLSNLQQKMKTKAEESSLELLLANKKVQQLEETNTQLQQKVTDLKVGVPSSNPPSNFLYHFKIK